MVDAPPHLSALLPVVGFAAAQGGDGEQHQRSKREDHGRGSEARSQRRKHCAREQPENVHNQDGARDLGMASPAACKPLVRMTAMRLVDPFAPQQAPEQGHGCVDKEHTAQDQPCPERNGILPGLGDEARSDLLVLHKALNSGACADWRLLGMKRVLVVGLPTELCTCPRVSWLIPASVWLHYLVCTIIPRTSVGCCMVWVSPQRPTRRALERDEQRIRAAETPPGSNAQCHL